MTHAQYTANFQTNAISGVTNTWSGVYEVGGYHYGYLFGDVLLIENGGVLTNAGVIGDDIGNSNNSVLVTGSGTVWSCDLKLIIGNDGCGNSLVVSNGGQVVSLPYQPMVGLGMYGSSSNNCLIVTGNGSLMNIPGGICVGCNGGGNSLAINDGGNLITWDCDVGVYSSENSVVVSDPGSVWNVDGGLSVGHYGARNNLVISNGGQVIDYTGFLGGSGNSNSVLVTGAGSVWRNDTLDAGQAGSWNSVVLSNGASLISSRAVIGCSGSCSNSVFVTTGAQWQCATLSVGGQGGSNSLIVRDGQVLASNLIVGASSPTCDNLLRVIGGEAYVFVTNATHTGVLEVRQGSFVLSGGYVQADTLVITNPCAQFIHTGGTAVFGGVVLDPNLFRITTVAPQTNGMLVTWLMGPGITNALQVTSGDARGNYNTNGFTDIFVVTSNPSLGVATNYLDAGATNTSSRYYRARLVP